MKTTFIFIYHGVRHPDLEDQVKKNEVTALFRGNGLKVTPQRMAIIDVLLRNRGHLNLERILEKARTIDPRVSSATVFRTVVFLEKASMINKMRLADNKTYYQFTPRGERAEHHDHLVCSSCGKIVEFYSGELESLQEKIAAEHGFEISSHTMEIHGFCSACSETAKNNIER